MTERTSSDEFVVVGIGASAGGIQAIRQFFEGVPADSGIAYVVILHLSPDHDSHLAEVLQVAAPIPVSQVVDQVEVVPDHVYVIPPDKSLTMEDGLLSVSPRLSIEERRAPVDIFFRTLAQSRGRMAVSVILSGTGANGSMGLKRIKELGGLTLVQKPEDAEFTDMPLHSLATGLVDQVLPVADMPAAIIAYRDWLERLKLPSTRADHSEIDEHALRDIFTELRVRTGHDFSNYKRATILRRIARRMSLQRLFTMSEYAHFLREHRHESEALLKDLLISVTNFFRDREAFEKLRTTLIPKLFAGKGEGDYIRVWTAGCATGEEAYSIAMLLAEHAMSLSEPPNIQLFATDIDESAIAIAREGVYSLNDAADVSQERLRRFFVKEGERYRVRKELRDLVLFANHNIIKDPPFSHLDLLCCRNVLIYLNRAAQRRAMEVMHFALNPGGYLFLGSSESVEGAGELFVAVDKEAFLFQSRAMTTRTIVVPLPELALPAAGDRRLIEARHSVLQVRERMSAADLHQRLLEALAPPSVVVNAEYEIVHLSPRAGRYLQHAGGEPSNDILKLIRPELRIELRTALYQSSQQRSNVEAPAVHIGIDNQQAAIRLVVRPVLDLEDTARGFFLILFEEDAAGVVNPRTPVVPLTSTDTTRQLEDEVSRMKGQLRATIERHETQAEELKASNEELQAMNEELRSSAEELETSKEELESTNEELRTVNQELKIKVEEQTRTNDDMQNLVNSTEIGTIFLDRSSRIKLFTPPAREIFTLIPADRGRVLSDISSALVDVDVHAEIERVLERLERVEREVVTKHGRWYLMRVLPYRTSEDRIDGITLTFVEITARRRAEQGLRASETRSRLLIESVSDHAIFTMDKQGLVDSWNPGATRLFQYDESEILGQPSDILFTQEDRDSGIPAYEREHARDDGGAPDERWHLRRDGSRFFASGIVSPMRDDHGYQVGFVKVARDLTEQKRWEEALQRAHDELETRVKDRTAELAAANLALDGELRERQQTAERIRGLLRRLITIQEDERRRIARDLHDHLGQQVAALGLRVDGLAQMAKNDAALTTAADAARETITKLDRDLDFFTWELRPATLDDFGLTATLANFVREWSKEFGIVAEFHGDDLKGAKVPFEAEINLYRIAQEALNNTYKHASATQVNVVVERRSNDLVLVLEDNGHGFQASQLSSSIDRGIGIIGMHERAALIGGVLEIETGATGTTVFVRVPLPSEASSST